jgi:maltose O-acetyltransferase
MRYLREIYKDLTRALSDLEFRVNGTKKNGLFRKLYLNSSGLVHGQDFRFGCNIYIHKKGDIRFGDRCALGSFAKIWNYSPITIGDDFLSAGCLTLNSATHDPITLNPVGRSISIGDRVWCGVNVTILAGVNIGNDVVIGAGSIVVSDIPSNSIAVGVPCKRIKTLDRSGHSRQWKITD